MEYTEFIDAIDAKLLEVDEDYWVCDYWQSATETRIDTPPSRAKLKLEILSTGLRNYSFRPYGKSGKLLNRSIPDSKVQRLVGFPIVARLQIFVNEKDCYERYLHLCNESKVAAEEEKKTLLEGMQTIENKLNEDIRLATARQVGLNSSP